MHTGAAISLTVNGRNAFDQRVIAATGAPLHAYSLNTVQVNIGLKCNLACRHCHVEASPKRAEEMTWKTMEQVLTAAKRCGAKTIDITGGEPAMHPEFRRFVAAARGAGFDVIVRTDLTIMLEEGYRDLPTFLAQQGVRIVASLPCYLPDNVNRQRGMRVYEKSVEVIQMLNATGFGRESHLSLELVYNPVGPSLPPDEAALEADYRRELGERFGIVFTRLITITNMPIGRFLHDLRRDGKGDDYERLLEDRFNADTIAPLMCRHQIHVSWDGTLHDCDFNYALGLPIESEAPGHIRDLDPALLARRPIRTDRHCFGCTAGQGSSCGGALA